MKYNFDRGLTISVTINAIIDICIRENIEGLCGNMVDINDTPYHWLLVHVFVFNFFHRVGVILDK